MLVILAIKELNDMKNIVKSKYEVCLNGNIINIFLNGKKLLSVGASASINDEVSMPEDRTLEADKAVFRGKDDVMEFDFLDDAIKVSYARSFSVETPIYVSKMFATPETAINVVDIDRGFTPQARNNSGKNMEFYRHLPDISANGYFSPSLFNFSIGNKDAWVSFGLLDIPDTKICKMDNDSSFLIESCGGNKLIPAGGTYKMPSVLITFPKDEWDGIRLFRQKLIDLGLYTPQKPKFSEIPSWWKNPFLCTYGDQMLEDIVGNPLPPKTIIKNNIDDNVDPGYKHISQTPMWWEKDDLCVDNVQLSESVALQAIDEAWVTDYVDIAERDWGFKNINLIIDDAWQLPHAFEPAVATDRFPDMRRFIDGMHKRGHHVILWQTSMFDVVSNGFETRAQRLNVLSDYKYEGVNDPGRYFAERGLDARAIDYTADNARQFIREICEIMFGSGEGQFDADGVKLDFIGMTRDPAKTNTYMHPERGIGARELLLFYEMFHEEAKKVKPDVLIDCTVGDPRFEHAIDFNRLHDTHCGTIEKDLRAAVASYACPGLPIDSDGALMFVSWLRTHYISSAIYGIPSLYYVKYFHDCAPKNDGFQFMHGDKPRKELTPLEKIQLGNLLQMTKYRPDGNAKMTSYGNWILEDNGKVNAMCQRGETVVYYPTESNDTGYIFTWQDEVICIPLYGRKISDLQGGNGCKFILADYAQDVAYITITPGEVYTFKNIDDGTSVDRNFIESRAINSETDMNYVNN